MIYRYNYFIIAKLNKQSKYLKYLSNKNNKFILVIVIICRKKEYFQKNEILNKEEIFN